MIAFAFLLAMAALAGYGYAYMSSPVINQPRTATILETATVTITAQETTSPIIGTTSAALIWSADFESGTAGDFNDTDVTACGATTTVSTSQAHGGSYAGYYYHVGGPTAESCRAYPTEQLSNSLTGFVLELWVYVPNVQLNDWVSFVTLRLSDDNIITLDSNPRQELHLWIGALQETIDQASPISWPFDKWFQIRIVADLHPDTTNSKINVYQDGTPIIAFTGYSGNGLLSRMHFGLYTGQQQGTFAVYNDDIKLWRI